MGFAVRIRGEVNPYRVLALAVKPGESVPVEVLRPAGGEHALVAEGGEVAQAGPRRWTWKAPQEHGLYPLRVERRAAAGESPLVMTLNAFVEVPAGRIERGRLNGYRIGAYPKEPLRGLAVYRPPGGFVEVTPLNAETPLSPHFTLGQFLCKQAGGFPKYVVLRERLLLKLEYLLRTVNEKGLRADTFAVLSGFRTPFYNHAIGNVRYSRHQWGGAADIFIDERPRDGVMDDLNGDGRIDRKDAALLYDLVESLAGGEQYESFVGGLGNYGSTASHGPFIHVDARGFRARWGR